MAGISVMPAMCHNCAEVLAEYCVCSWLCPSVAAG